MKIKKIFEKSFGEQIAACLPRSCIGMAGNYGILLSSSPITYPKLFKTIDIPIESGKI